jgi:nitric oxide dioxygenase
MLSDLTIAIVKSTAPVLQEHGETLTKHFYKRMFSQNPEVAPYFNPANQAVGVQQRALAGAICAYAANIDNLEVLGNAVELIAQKHASLQIKPEHYPIVGENLLASIQEVLGEGATKEVIDAWAEAYGFLADIMIGRENQIYTEHSHMKGGWLGFKSFKVAKKEKESDVITSFYLVPEDGSELPTFKPGQYITVRVKTPNGQTTMRNYSLSDKPGQPWFRISVKREVGLKADTPEGFVSNYVHEQIEAGATLEIAPPCGEFFLDITEKHERPLVLLSAGVGITPLLSMLLSALEVMPEREIIFIHGSLSEATQAFKKIIDDLAAKHRNLKTHYRYSNLIGNDSANANIDTGFIDAALIESKVPQRDADYYFCGPQPFMVNIYHELLKWGIPASQVHFEFFGPRQELEMPKSKLKCPV